MEEAQSMRTPDETYFIKQEVERVENVSKM